MATPVINPVTSIQEHRQYEAWNYQPSCDQAETLKGTVIDVDTVANSLQINGHGMANGTRVRVAATTALPAPLEADVVYYIVNTATDTFKLALTAGGAAIDLTTEGAGTIVVYLALFWEATGLPTGMTIDLFTGLVSGQAEIAGVFNAVISATNSADLTGTLAFCIGIEGVAGVGATDPTLCVNGLTKTLARVGSQQELIPAGEGPLLWLTRGDKETLLVRFHRAGSFYTPDLTSLTLTLKQYDTEGIILTAGGDTLDTDFKILGAGNWGYAALRIHVVGDLVDSGLSEYAKDDGGPSFFYAVGQIEWKEPNIYGFAGDDVRTSQSFIVQIESEQQPS